MFKKIIVFFYVLLFINRLAAQIDYKGFPQWSWHKEDSTEYYLYTPVNMKTDVKYPIALFMHGCCGDSYRATLRNTVDPPLRMWHNFGANTQTVPTYIIAPATSRGWQQHFKNLKKVMDDLVANHNGDPQRIYVCGFSMGGEGVFKFIQDYPDYFAAAIPMGMSFHGDSVKIKDIPLWIHQGETDWWSRFLKNTVSGMRRLNGDMTDTGSSNVTGVNPRYSNFRGVDHGVQWIAASKQDITGWAYSKINDGNKYPVVYFISPAFGQVFRKGEYATIAISATDPDGSVVKTDIFINGVHFKTLQKPPFMVAFKPVGGDTKIEAIGTDNQGKKTIATTRVKVDEKTKIITEELPFGRQGALYISKLQSNGNGEITYRLANGSLPNGYKLLPNGTITGIAQQAGLFQFEISASDEDGDIAALSFKLLVKEKRKGEIIIRNAVTDSGKICDIGKIKKGETLFTGATDDEISFSETGSYEGLTFIKLPASDTARREENYLTFETDEDATIYIGYEKKDRLFRSGIPSWLSEFSNQPTPQIVAQYYYYDVYAKSFPKGKILLPGADEKRNNSSTGYFVMIKKDQASLNLHPEITTTKLSKGITGRPYEELLTVLYGKGAIQWRINKGSLPPGLNLLKNGSVSGTPIKKGTYAFVIQAADIDGNKSIAELKIDIE